MEFFRSKGYHVGFGWQDTAALEHAGSFTVAKAMELDILRDIRGAVDKALAEGTTFEAFRDELEPLLRRRGWWGRQLMKDPLTGEERMVQLGSLSRLRTIFDTNLRTSYAAGQWTRIQRVKDDMPFLRYSAVLDRRVRPQHRAWDGVVLPVDHPFWRTHYPPNGWRCRCSVTQFSERQLRARGYEVSEEPPPGWDRTREWVNKRTGEVQRVQIGIDPGWGHNTGVVNSTQKLNRLNERLDELSGLRGGLPDGQAGERAAKAMIRGALENPAFLDFLTGAVPGDWPVAIVPQAVLGAIRGRSRVLRLSQYTANKQAGRIEGIIGHPDVGPQDYLRVQGILDEGESFISKKNPRSALSFIESDGRPWRAVVKATEDGEKTFLETLHKGKERDLAYARDALLPIILRGGR